MAGELKVSAGPIGWANSLHAKVWAVRDGLSLCIQLQLPNVEIELDAKSVMDLLNSSKAPLLTMPLWLMIAGT